VFSYVVHLTGLSRVVCASFTEDLYGVVQPSISVILSTLLDMLDVSSYPKIQTKLVLM